MLDWLKNINKEYPDFWKTYISKFEKKSSRFVVLSTETSGFDTSKDVILSIGSFSVINNSILIGDNFEAVVLQYKFFHDNGISNEFVVESTMKKLGEADAVKLFIEFIENSVLVGHNIDLDVEMINAALERIDCGRLKNEALDIGIMHNKLHEINDKQFSMKELCAFYNIAVNERNSAVDDAYRTALLFLKLKSRLGIK